MNWKLKIVAILILGLISTLSFSGIAVASSGSQENSVKQEIKVDGYEVELIFEEGQPQTGDNEIKVELHDPQGQPVNNARIIIKKEASDSQKNMVAGQSTMMKTEVELKAGKEDGDYLGDLDFDDAGKWTIKVNFIIQQQEKSGSFTVEVVKIEPNYGVLLGFLIVNVAIITVAAVTRKKVATAAGKMMFFKMVLKDVIRRKKRVLYAALGVVIGTMTVVGILTIALAGQERITAQLEKYGPNLSVVPAISNVDMKLGDINLGSLAVGENYIAADKLSRMQQIADEEIRMGFAKTGTKFQDDGGKIATLAPKLFMNTKVEGMSVMIVGIEPSEEIKIKTWWKIEEGEYIQTSDQAIAGVVAAFLFQLKVGSPISINSNNLTVSGILDETGSNDDYQIFIPLDTLQKAFNKQGFISSIDIRALCNACPVEDIANALNKDFAGIRAVAVKQVAETEMGMLEKINRFMIAMAVITLAVGLFGVINTMMTSVHERIKDIGIMRAVGASRNQIIKIFIYEALIIGMIGGILGYITGSLLAYIIGPLLLEGANVHYVPIYFPVALGLAMLVAILATTYPSFLATKIRVADSFRSL